MLRFDSDAASDAENTPAAAARRSARARLAPQLITSNLPVERGFPRWARINETAAGADDPTFFAGAGLALLDQLLAGAPPFAGALRQRLALRAAAACASMARLREDERDLRDAEHLAPGGEAAHTSPAGRIHRLWRLFASRSIRLDASTLQMAADLLGLPDAASFDAFAGALRDIKSSAAQPLSAAAGASAAAVNALEDAPPVDIEVFALWAADLVLAVGLGWEAPVPLLATTIMHPSLRRGQAGRRPRPGDADWAEAAARAYALAAPHAHALAGELSRRSEKLLTVAPKLRAKSAGRVVDLLLSDDAVSPTRTAKAAGLSDRAARRLFDRLTQLGAVRELSGRPSFRLYGL